MKNKYFLFTLLLKFFIYDSFASDYPYVEIDSIAFPELDELLEELQKVSITDTLQLVKETNKLREIQSEQPELIKKRKRKEEEEDQEKENLIIKKQKNIN